MKLIAVLLLASVLATPATAQEPDKRTPLERYRGDGQYTMIMCPLRLRLALLGSDDPEKTDWRGCIRDGANLAKTNFAAALKTVRKPKAQEALKNYHVALLAAIEGIAPGNEEIRMHYEQRQQALQGKVGEAWTRFEIEQ